MPAAARALCAAALLFGGAACTSEPPPEPAARRARDAPRGNWRARARARDDKREHIAEYDDSPTVFTVPELAVPTPGYAALAQLPPEGGAVAVSHFFLGVTDVGHVSYSFDAVRKASSVHTDDYAAALARATVTCARVDGVRAAEPRNDDGSRTRHDLILNFTFAAPAAGAADDGGAAQFLARVRAPDAYLTLDQNLHATHPSFARRTPCARFVHWEHSSFIVADAVDAPGGGVSLTLAPALPRDTHHTMRVKATWDPDAARAVAARRAAGLPVGVDVRRRRLNMVNLGSATLGMNWNGNEQSPAAANATIEFVPGFPGLLTCENCFAYVKAVYNVDVNFCMGINILSFVWFYTSNDMTGAITNSENLLLGWRSKSAKAALTATNLYDCTAAFAPWAAAAPDNKGGDWVPEQTAPTSAKARYINAAFNVDASVGGTAAFNFLVTSKGFATQGVYPATGCALAGGATDSTLCAAPAVLAASPLIVLNIGYISATIWSGLHVAATWSGALTGSMRIGAGASVGTPCAPVSLGGRLQITDMQALIDSCDSTENCLAAMSTAPNILRPYTSFPFAYTLTPLNVKLDANVGAAVDVSISIVTKIVIAGCIPITAAPLVRLTASAALGQARRAASLRALSAPPTAATCPRAGAFVGAALSSQFVASVGPTTVSALLSGLGVLSAATLKKLPSCITNALIIPYTVISPPALTQTLPLAAACVAPSAALTAAVSGSPSGSVQLPPTPAADATLTALGVVATATCSSSLSALWTSTSVACSRAAGQAGAYQSIMCVCAGAGAASAVCAAEQAAYQAKYFPPPPLPPPFPLGLVIGCAVAALLVFVAAYLLLRRRAALAAAAAAAAKEKEKEGKKAAVTTNPMAGAAKKAAAAKKGKGDESEAKKGAGKGKDDDESEAESGSEEEEEEESADESDASDDEPRNKAKGAAPAKGAAGATPGKSATPGKGAVAASTSKTPAKAKSVK